MARSSRKQEILQAALACFTEFGVEATTIEMIRDRSGASIGSLYHHFGNRERIIAALYLEGIGEYAALLEAGLIETLDAEACVRLFVTSYIDWVVANPDWARFVLHNRGRVEAGKWASSYARSTARMANGSERSCVGIAKAGHSGACRATAFWQW